LYIGNGTVIEASGTQAGVITTKITNTKWCEWGELKGVVFTSTTTTTTTTTPSTPATSTTTTTTKSALVTGTRLALRAAPSTDAAILTRVNTGERVQLLDDTEWVKVKY